MGGDSGEASGWVVLRVGKLISGYSPWTGANAVLRQVLFECSPGTGANAVLRRVQFVHRGTGRMEDASCGGASSVDAFTGELVGWKTLLAVGQVQLECSPGTGDKAVVPVAVRVTPNGLYSYHAFSPEAFVSAITFRS